MSHMATFQHLLVATDFSDVSGQALEVAVELALERSASLTVVHTCEVPTYAYADLGLAPLDLLTPIADVAGKRLEELLRSVRERCPKAVGVLKVGVPWEQILAAAAETGADLVVVGTHGRRGVAHAVMGSVAERIVRSSPIPVMTIRQ